MKNSSFKRRVSTRLLRSAGGKAEWPFLPQMNSSKVSKVTVMNSKYRLLLHPLLIPCWILGILNLFVFHVDLEMLLLFISLLFLGAYSLWKRLKVAYRIWKGRKELSMREIAEMEHATRQLKNNPEVGVCFLLLLINLLLTYIQVTF
ncbi:hypothetical protein ACFYKX_10635 [Cytobacillus sp. FJAT-54145]|uniref:DUF3899 domain-containing protein n=1 Tax=Cytobacillus spartinae TaxID=3299023 RepID=A0ABW6KA10_9BACI